MMHPNPNAAHDTVTRLFLHHRAGLEATLTLILRDSALVQDTLSQLLVTLLQASDQYDPCRPFPPWARSFARNLAFAALRDQQLRDSCLDPAVLDTLAAEIEDAGADAELDRRKLALEGCLARLSSRHRRLIHFRFFEGRDYSEIAARVGKSVGAVYVLFDRVLDLLLSCIEQQLAEK